MSIQMLDFEAMRSDGNFMRCDGCNRMLTRREVCDRGQTAYADCLCNYFQCNHCDHITKVYER